MSGIFGFYKTSDVNNNSDENVLKKMAVWNEAYGNASGKNIIFKNLAIGCFIEKLNKDLDTSSPVIESDDQLAVIDAVIYNRSELKSDLKCDLNASISDEELLFLYINEYGYDALEKVNGDFAGAIYDKKKNSITLFRDHLGVRPLFYYFSEDNLLFSTDIRGIIAIPEVDASISEEWIYKILGGYFTDGTEKTEFQNIQCIKPGSYARFTIEKNMKKEAVTYWTLGNHKIKHKSDEEYQKQLRSLIEDSIKIRLEAVSGMVGAELSGGLDSGVIDIIINRLGRECVYYSWSNSPEIVEMAKNDERLIIQDICKQEGIKCNYGRLSLMEDSLFAEKYKKTGADVDFKEMPAFRFSFPPYINTPTIAQTATDVRKLGASVVFCGHGGDEGVSHRCDPYEMFYYKEYYHYFRYMFSTTNGMKHRVRLTLNKCLHNLIDNRKEYMSPFVSSVCAPEFINSELKKRFETKKMPAMSFLFDPIAYVKSGGSGYRLDNVSLLGAYGGVRYLIPYLDYRVIDYAVSIPRYQYLRGRKDRYIFREAFKDIMPDSLYRLRIKETMSQTKIKDNPNWFESFNEDKRFVISKLKRSNWNKYLDFDALERFENAGEPKGEEKARQNMMYLCLYQLALAQNVLDKVRG